MTVTLDRNVEQFIATPRQLFINGQWVDAASGGRSRGAGPAGAGPAGAGPAGAGPAPPPGDPGCRN